MSKSIEVYSLLELKEKFPDSYEKVLERWQNQDQDDIPWTDEIFASLKAVIEACGGELKDWSIGTESYRSYLKVRVSDTWDDSETDEDGDLVDIERDKDAKWFEDNLADTFGADKLPDGSLKFNGACKLTGYCADDDFAETVYKALKDGETLTEALEGLDHKASKMIEDELTDMLSEDSMFTNYEGCYFTKDGTMV